MLALERGSMFDATQEWMESDEAIAWRNGDNLTEGLAAFAGKRAPVWKNPARVIHRNNKSKL